MADGADIRAGRAFVELYVKSDEAKTKEAIKSSTVAAKAELSKVGDGQSAISSIGASISKIASAVRAGVSQSA